MAAQNALEFLRSLQRAAPAAPALAICGPQAFLREYVFDACRAALAREGLAYRGFQVGAGLSFAAALAELSSPDLFASKKLVACRVLRSYRERGGDPGGEPESASPPARSGGRGDEEALAAAIAQARGPNRLLLIYERDSLPAKVRRAIERDGLAITCMRPFDNQIEPYAQLFARALSLELTGEAAALLAARHGADLGAIANAIECAAIGGAADAIAGQPAIADLPPAARRPELFALSESLTTASPARVLLLFDRAVAAGRDPIELLAVEIVPAVRRMLTAAAVLAQRKSAGQAAAAMGFPPGSRIAAAAIDGARRIGLKRLERAHRRACELDAGFKMGLLKEREQALSALLLEMLARPERGGETAAGR